VPYDKGRRKDQCTGSYGDFKPVQVKSTGERFPTDAIYCKTAESENGGKVWHPTQKPVALGRYLIRTFTAPGEVVLDNAFGSGSFLVAAAIENRKYIGIEKNEEVHLFKKKRIDYVSLAARRLANISKSEVYPLFRDMQPSARMLRSTNDGFVDIDELLAAGS